MLRKIVFITVSFVIVFTVVSLAIAAAGNEYSGRHQGQCLFLYASQVHNCPPCRTVPAPGFCRQLNSLRFLCQGRAQEIALLYWQVGKAGRQEDPAHVSSDTQIVHI